MAVGIVVGVAFATVVQSLVADVLMPPIGLLFGDVDFSQLFVVLSEGTTAGPYATLAAAQEAGAVTLNYGRFINTIITFLIVAACVFLIVRRVNKLRPKPEPVAKTTKECPECASQVPLKAKRCAHCTSSIQ